MSLNIIFAGTPNFAATTLQALINSRHKVVAVYTKPDSSKGRGRKRHASPIKELALTHHIPVHQPKTLRYKKVQNELATLNADVMIVIAYGLILPKSVLGTPKHGCLNVHASLLPRWRGAAPIQRAILAGDQETGITIMQMDEGLDTGDMLFSVATKITHDDTAITLHDRLAHMGADALLTNLNLLEQNKLKPISQNDSKATYAEKILKSDGNINWQEPAEIIARKIRAFSPWPGTFFNYKNQVIKIWRSAIITTPSQEKPGTIININTTGIDITTAENTCRIKKLQLPGGKPITVQDFLNAHPNFFSLGKI